jgi:hypothetical protein
MKHLKILNTLTRGFPLLPSVAYPDAKTLFVPASSVLTVGPEYHEGRHFQALRRKGTLRIMKEFDVQTPKAEVAITPAPLAAPPEANVTDPTPIKPKRKSRPKIEAKSTD